MSALPARARAPVTMRSLALVVAAAAMYDIHMQMYKDENCFEPASDEKFLVGGCYANYISNASVAFSIQIVALNEPRKLAIDMYSDHCHHLIEERYIFEATCEAFFGDYHGFFTLQPRVACYGGECQTITVADQTFYEQANCNGLEMLIQPWPVSTMSITMQETFGSVPTVGMDAYADSSDGGFELGLEPGEEEEEKFTYRGPESLYTTGFLPTPKRSAKDYCLRSMNGTKMYMRNPNGSQIHEFVFPMSANCEPLDFVGYRWFAYTTGHCYQMQEGYSFRWYTIKGHMIQGLAAAGALLALLVATL